MTDTVNLGIALLAAEQAQKHVTMNEALARIDNLVMMAVISAVVTVPPGSPAEGDRYIVPVGATGAWLGMTNLVAAYSGGAWVFYVPKAGWLAWNIATATMMLYSSAAWAAFSGGGGVSDGDKGHVIVSGGGSVWSLDFPAVNALIAPVWGNVTAKPTTIATSGLTDGVDLASAQVVTNKTFTDALTTFQDDADTSKKMRFDLVGVGTATTRILGMPSADGTLATLSGAAQTFANTTTFSAATVTVGTSASASTLGLGTGATTTGLTKAINIGIAGLSGSTSNIAIGSAVAGALGTLTLNSPTITFGANVTAIDLPDAVTFFVDSIAPTKKLQFDASLIAPATTRVVQAPDASGVMVLADAAQTLTNKSIAVSQLTGVIGAANGGTGQASLPLSLGALFGYTETATAAATTTLTNASTALQAFTGTTTQIVVTPIAGNVIPGFTYIINNRSTGALTVNANNGTNICTIAASEEWMLTCIGVSGAGPGVWQAVRISAPAGGGSPGGSTTQVQYNLGGSFAGATEVEIENNQLRLKATTSLTPPAAGGVKLIGRADAGRAVPAFLAQDGIVREIQTFLGRSSAWILKAQPGSTTVSAIGGTVPTATGIATAVSPATTNLITYTPRIEYLVTVAAVTAVAGFRQPTTLVTCGGPSAGLGGFAFVCRWGPSTGVATTTCRAGVGLVSGTTAPTDVEPSTSTSCVFMGWDAADTNMQIMHNDGLGTCTKIDLGAPFPVPSIDRNNLYELALFSPKGTTQSVDWLVTDLVSGATASGTITTNLPTTASLLAGRGWMSVGGTSSVIGIALNSMVLDPLL